MAKTDYLERILNARVYDVAIESPLEPAPNLSKRTHNRILLKREDMQPVFSFKLRGAYNKMVQLSAEQRARGVICASAGNHAQGVALSAHKLGARAVIVMPTTTPVTCFRCHAAHCCNATKVSSTTINNASLNCNIKLDSKRETKNVRTPARYASPK